MGAKKQKLPVYNRMSVLSVSQFCGKAPLLGEKYGAGRAAAMGTAFHACAAEEPDRDAKLASLTDDELAEVMTWAKPADIQVEAAMLSYAETTGREVEVGLDKDGGYCEASSPDLITLGHVDMYWHVGDTIYVGDIKKSKWTVDSPDTLQLRAYGLALAEKHGADRFLCGIWAATEAEWSWSDPFDLLDTERLWEVIQHAASNRGEASVGGHCRGCYGRLHCEEHLLPAALTSSAELAELTEGAEITPEGAYAALLQVKAMEDLAKAAKGIVQEYARRSGGIPDGAGKIYVERPTKGRKSYSKAKFEEAGLDPEDFKAEGKPGSSFRWVNAPKAVE